MFANGCPCTKAALVAGVVEVAGAEGVIIALIPI
jgi:hypothetical protein